MKNPVLFIRADASEVMGSGHVMRCMALAQCWQRQYGPVVFAMAISPPAPLHDLLVNQGFQIVLIKGQPGSLEDAASTIAKMEEVGTKFFALDGYHFHSSYQKRLKQQSLRLLLFDDNRDWDHYHADIILNQNLYAKKSMYPQDLHEPDCKFLLGSNYCLLRNDFLQAETPVTKQRGQLNHLLITFGGSDPDNYTGKVIEALQLLNRPKLKACILLGAGNRNKEAVTHRAAQLPFHTEVIHYSDQMPQLIARADLAISAGGSTFYEFCYMRLPALLAVVADNQYQLVKTACSKGYAMGPMNLLDSVASAHLMESALENTKRLQKISHRIGLLVDGHGAERVCKQLIQG